MSSLIAPVRPKRARSGECPICSGSGCSIWRSGGTCAFCVAGVWRNRTCRFCAGTGERQATIVCRRVLSAHATKSGNGWIHSPDADVIANLPPLKPEYDLAPIAHRHAVYSALLDSLPLTGYHDNYLRTVRGLSEEAITAAEFASAPKWRGFDDEVFGIAEKFDLIGVPGFFQVRDKWCWRGCGSDGVIIPIRDEQRQIQALQIRWLQPKNPKAKYMLVSGAPDKLPHAGTRSGAPNHFIRFDASATSVLIVEGILKSEIVADYAHLVGLRCPIVACVGTGSYGEMGSQLKRLMPRLRVAWTAFDWDESGSKSANDTQLRRERLHRQFQAVGVSAEALRWTGYKGFDDALMAKARANA